MTAEIRELTPDLASYLPESVAAHAYLDGKGTLEAPLRLAIVLTHADFADEGPPEALGEAGALVGRTLLVELGAGASPADALMTAHRIAQHTERYHSAIAATLVGPILAVAGVGRSTVAILATQLARVEVQPTVLEGTAGVLSEALGARYDRDTARQRRLRVEPGEAVLFLAGGTPSRWPTALRPPTELIHELLEDGLDSTAIVALVPGSSG